jgi:hypothetical protein
MRGHNLLHANRQAGNLRAQASRDAVHLCIRANPANRFLLYLGPGSRCGGFCWAVCVHDKASNGFTGFLAYNTKHAVNASNCQRCRVTRQMTCAVDDVWADSFFPERPQSPEQEQLGINEQLWWNHSYILLDFTLAVQKWIYVLVGSICTLKVTFSQIFVRLIRKSKPPFKMSDLLTWMVVQ